MSRALKGKEMILAGLGLAVLYWLLETVVVDVLIFQEGSVTDRLLLFPGGGEEGHELWARLLPVALIIASSATIQIFVNRSERTREHLRESEERFRTAFEDAPIGVCLLDLDGRRLKVNHALCEVLGYAEEDLLGRDYLEVVHPDDREISTEHFRSTLEAGAGNYMLERRYIRADGDVVWNLTSVSLVQDARGNPSYFICLHQNITGRKRTEEEGRKLNEEIDQSPR